MNSAAQTKEFTLFEDGLVDLGKSIFSNPGTKIRDLKTREYKMSNDSENKAKTNDFEHNIEDLSTGIDVYLTKFFREEELLKRLEKINELRIILKNKLSQFPPIEKPKSLKNKNSFLIKVDSVIEENMHNSQFSVEELAKRMHMCRMQLHRRLKAVSKKSTCNYIRSYRLNNSKTQLCDLSLRISEVAWAVGFNDVNYYSKCFQREFGMNPSEYRTKLKSERMLIESISKNPYPTSSAAV